MVVLTSDCLSIWERSPLQCQTQHMICSRLPLLLPSFPDDHFDPCPTLWMQPAYFNSFLGHPRSRRVVTYLVIEGPGLALLLCSLKPSSAERNVLAAKTKIKNVPRVWGWKQLIITPSSCFMTFLPYQSPSFFVSLFGHLDFYFMWNMLLLKDDVVLRTKANKKKNGGEKETELKQPDSARLFLFSKISLYRNRCCAQQGCTHTDVHVCIRVYSAAWYRWSFPP